ncbi:MAG: hypothetical protein HC816_00050 [Leptolyngbyaceae cyanobacterium RM1_1_2]|nr:hypothetical protein [Leptolyngbyaceae cyanobacterium RM1_1_2]
MAQPNKTAVGVGFYCISPSLREELLPVNQPVNQVNTPETFKTSVYSVFEAREVQKQPRNRCCTDMGCTSLSKETL